MFTKSSEKTMPEFKLAKNICRKLKNTAAQFDSDNPLHKNGKRYVISLKIYNSIIQKEIENKNLSTTSAIKVRKFIEQQLIAI